MKFVQRSGVWHLIDENSPDQSGVLATLKNDAEILALKKFCEYYSEAGARGVPEHLAFEHQGIQYTVTPVGALGEKLRLILIGSDGTSGSIETGLILS
jgi:hypothetical protein